MEEIWKDIPNLSSVQNPSNSFDGMNLQEFLARPFLYPNYNLNPVFPASNVMLLTPQANSLTSHHAVSNMTCSSQQHPGFGTSMPSSGSARKRTAIPREHGAQNNISTSSRSDRRNQRLIKNRESAARSRDRKEAYTTQLVHELEALKAENAKLKKEQKLRDEAQDSKKHTLNRTSSSPF